MRPRSLASVRRHAGRIVGQRMSTEHDSAGEREYFWFAVALLAVLLASLVNAPVLRSAQPVAQSSH
jgi:hypothetical protein